MKKFTIPALLLSLLLGVTTVQAREISVDEALQTAQTFITKEMSSRRMAKSPLKLIAQANTTTGVAYYVFAPEKGEGFTIISGNDVAAPVLGYSEFDVFDASNMPEGLKFMLDNYRNEIEFATSNGYGAYEPRNAANEGKSEILPICKTTWDQDAPYWNLCPSKMYTGCVATAMAQAVYVYKYPEKSKGTAVWNNTTVTFNRTYSWSNMLPSYSSGYTTAQGTAVAELMVDLGKSVDMSYSYSGSGAETEDVPAALVNNFSYDPACAYSQADNWPVNDWNEIMYYQLEQGWPIIYGGFGTGYNGGHQFIADGWRTGNYFHINWGWGGVSDGYYLLTALSPGSQGAGGNTSNFSTGCDAVYNVYPPRENSEVQTQISCRGNFTSSTSTSSATTFRVTSGSLWGSTLNGFVNLGGFAFKAEMGVRLINKDDPSKIYTVAANNGLINFTKWGNVLSTINVTFNNIADGTYYVFPMSKASGKDYWERVMCPRGKQQYVVMTVSDGSKIFSTPTTPNYVPVNTLYLPVCDSVMVNHTLRINPTVIPYNADNTALRYKSSNEQIATVDSVTGIVRGISLGSCEIYATTTDGSLITAKMPLNVIEDSHVGNIDDEKNLNKRMDVYTITGILVGKDMMLNEMRNLAPGIYIAGGRKYVIR